MNFIEAYIESLAVHEIGNKIADEGYILSENETFLDQNLRVLLGHYFLSPFKIEEFYHFQHDVDLSMNELYNYVSNIFSDPETLCEQSRNIAKHLYNQTLHPKIRQGEFYVAHLKGCVLDDEVLDAVGIFKSERKDTFFEVQQADKEFKLLSHQGISINKLDKGCIIFNTNQSEGFTLAIVDNTNKGYEAQYWKTDFLNVLPLSNSYNQTKEFLGMTKQFITKELINQDVDKPEQIDLLNRSIQYFQDHKAFDKQTFEEEVFSNDEYLESFHGFEKSYRESHEIDISDSFEISGNATKKQSRAFKRVLKLDKNFHIYIHGDKELMEKGYDQDTGRSYYKIYFDEET